MYWLLGRGVSGGRALLADLSLASLRELGKNMASVFDLV